METGQKKKDILRHRAEMLLWKTEWLIETCDGWLSPEEGLKNVENRIRQRNRNVRKTRFLAAWTRLKEFFN
jgi:hypothetical protein